MLNELKKVDVSALEHGKKHLYYHHDQAKGWITLAKKERDTSWKQYHYQFDQIEDGLASWQGENVYFSQNTFYKPQRRIENIKQLRALYVDIDCHNLNYDPHWVAGKLNMEVFQEYLPTPNVIIYSGRGLVCIWLIEPVPSQALPLWKALQNYFFKQVEYVGADKKSMDPTRVFRIAGSINSKSGKNVYAKYNHDYRYRLRDLQEEYLPELKRTQIKKKGNKSTLVRIHNLQTLNYARLTDLVKIAELRNFDLKGYRETICFLYRYWSCCFTNDPEDALLQMLEFNAEFKDPLHKREVIRATKSAEKAWEAKLDETINREALEKGYPGAGYNFKNATIIRWLDITSKEQKYMLTLIDAKEKLKRKRSRDKKAFREKNGSITRAEYLEQESEKTNDMLWQLQKAINQQPHLSNVKLAKLLSVSESYIRKLKKKLNEQSPRTGSRP